MLIDRTHRPWAIGTGAALLTATVTYIVEVTTSTIAPRGGSAVGLTYGIIGFAMMGFAGLLSARKKVPIWRIGRAQSWMRGHLWLGLLSLPLILFHAAFDFGGPLTRVLMWLFIAVIVSGVVGAALQHVMPRLMTERVPMETIYEQIPHIRQQLVDESDALVAQACGALDVAATAAVEGEAVGNAASLATIVRIEADDTAPLRQFYLREMRPFVAAPESVHPLANVRYAQQQFERLRMVLPASAHATVVDLENLCEEERQLSRQLRMHHLLHGWLLVHLPLSFALVALAVIHIVAALRY